MYYINMSSSPGGNNGNQGNGNQGNGNQGSGSNSPTSNGTTSSSSSSSGWTYTTANVISSATFIPNTDSLANVLLNQTITGDGYVITNEQGITASGNVVTETTFDTTANATIDIDEDLVGTVSAGYDDSSATGQLVAEIRDYANKIKCEEFHGKGSIDDYNALFTAAAKIANESKQMKLDVEIEGFDDFGKAADDLAALFVSFTKRLQTVNIIDDSDFLRAVLNALKKIDNLSNVFGKFKDTILLTSTIRIPASAHHTSLILSNVMAEVNCAMNYINHFVNPIDVLPAANLSVQDQNIIQKAVTTIDDWNVLCEQGVTIALSNNQDIQYIKQVNNELKTKTNSLKSATDTLRAKLLSLTS